MNICIQLISPFFNPNSRDFSKVRVACHLHKTYTNMCTNQSNVEFKHFKTFKTREKNFFISI